MQILIKRKVDGPSVPELGTPTSATFDTVIVPLARASTGPNAISAYTIERATSASGPWTVAATGLGIFGSPPTQYVDGGRTAVTAYYYRAKAADAQGRESGYCATVSVTTAAIPNSRKNWNPGNYVFPDHIAYPYNDDKIRGAVDAVNGYANNSRITGVQVAMPWARVEPQLNAYAFDWLDTLIARITQNGTNSRKVLLYVWGDTYGGAASLPTVPQNQSSATFPDYAITAGMIGLATTSGTTLRWDVPAMTDRLIALYQQLFTRYGDRLDVEAILTSETSRFVAGGNMSTWSSEWARFATALGAMSSGKRAWAVVSHNGLPSSAGDRPLVDAMNAANVGFSTSDIVGWYATSPLGPPGVNFDRYGFATLKLKMNYGYSAYDNATYTNAAGADTRSWFPMMIQQQVVRRGCVSNDNVRFYSDEWMQNSHPVWTLRIGAGGGSYCTDLYGSSTPAPADFCGNNTLAYLTSSGVAPRRSAYPVRP
jgi:hypothetical protein